MDRRRFLKAASGLFVPAIPAIISPARAQGPILPGPGLPVAAAGLGLQTNLGSFFSLDNTLADATGAVTNLTNNNTVTFVSPPGGGLAAVTNCAAFVAASSQYLSHADATGINVAGGIDFSIQFWYYATGNSNFFTSKATGGFGSREFEISYGFGTGSANPITVGINNLDSLATGNITNTAWHHFVFTFNNTSKATIIYIDGSSAATKTMTGVTTAGTSQLNIGANASPGNYWAGNFALYGIWRNRVLSSGDVTSLYNSGAGRSYAAMV